MAMSTPIAQLPKQAPSQPAQMVKGAEEDPVVNDVINEMEKEFSGSQQAPQPMQLQPQPQLQFTPPPPTYAYIQQSKKPLIDQTIAKRAAVCAIIALVLFYPFETGALYAKVPYLAKMQDYERAIRTVLLAVLLYVIMWKLDI